MTKLSVPQGCGSKQLSVEFWGFRDWGEMCNMKLHQLENWSAAQANIHKYQDQKISASMDPRTAIVDTDHGQIYTLVSLVQEWKFHEKSSIY